MPKGVRGQGAATTLRRGSRLDAVMLLLKQGHRLGDLRTVPDQSATEQRKFLARALAPVAVVVAVWSRHATADDKRVLKRLGKIEGDADVGDLPGFSAYASPLHATQG